MRRLLLVLLLWPTPTPAAEPPLSQARDEARLVLEARCGACHVGAYPTAVPGALAIYDLSQTEWASTLTKPQREDILGRLADPQGLDETVTGPADPAEIATVRRYFERLP